MSEMILPSGQVIKLDDIEIIRNPTLIRESYAPTVRELTDDSVESLFSTVFTLLKSEGQYELEARLEELDKDNASPLEKIRKILEIASEEKLVGEP